MFYFKWTGQISSTAYVHLFAALILLFLLIDILLNALSRVVLQNSKPCGQSKFTRLASFSSVLLFLLLWALQEQMLENVPDVLQISLLIALLSMSLVFFVMASRRERGSWNTGKTGGKLRVLVYSVYYFLAGKRLDKK